MSLVPSSQGHCLAVLSLFLRSCPASLAPHALGPISVSPLRVSEGSPGGQWDSPSTGGSSPAAGATSTAHRWIDAAGVPAAQQARPGRTGHADGRAELILAGDPATNW